MWKRILVILLSVYTSGNLSGGMYSIQKIFFVHNIQCKCIILCNTSSEEN